MTETPTRQRILDAAIDQFGVRGVEAVSLDEIARAVGVRKQTVLYWFPSKDALIDAVLESVAADGVQYADGRPKRDDLSGCSHQLFDGFLMATGFAEHLPVEHRELIRTNDQSIAHLH